MLIFPDELLGFSFILRECCVDGFSFECLGLTGDMLFERVSVTILTWGQFIFCPILGTIAIGLLLTLARLLILVLGLLGFVLVAFLLVLLVPLEGLLIFLRDSHPVHMYTN